MTPTLTEIIGAVADRYGVGEAEMLGPLRWQELVRPRHVAMYIMRETTETSLTRIGHKFGRHHTSVMHAVDKVETDDELHTEAVAIEGKHGWERWGS